MVWPQISIERDKRNMNICLNMVARALDFTKTGSNSR
jgi:hypothetical protein